MTKCLATAAQTGCVEGIGDDELQGGLGFDTMYGDAGNDVMYGDFIHTQTNDGGNKMSGGKGDDFLQGSAGADLIHGGNGDDQLFGMAGIDRLFGGNQDDLLDGGDDGTEDQLQGGRGTDTFIQYADTVSLAFEELALDFMQDEDELEIRIV